MKSRTAKVFVSIADRGLARELNVPFTGVWLDAPMPVLSERVTQRRSDASDTDAEMVARQAYYDLGAIGWKSVNAARSPEQVIQDVRAILRNG